MQAEYLSINEGGEGQIVEQIGKVFPHIRIAIFAQTFVVEAVHLSNLSRLVIATQDGDSFTITDLESDQQRHRLHRIVTAIDIVAHEQVICVGWASAYPKQFH